MPNGIKIATATRPGTVADLFKGQSSRGTRIERLKKIPPRNTDFGDLLQLMHCPITGIDEALATLCDLLAEPAECLSGMQ
ncbi:hypothetical protein [Rhizobium sp. BK060]|uniref:hypothetical protein n=1 Tax=Rhizobium sp. BK060 TaxID=2587096 RepID=UPI001609C7F3|nr:hypothetical protein [Rhizobium sp. BK060]MBB3395497.1 hypothetical protein [Rhizobium sp. BK060]